MGKQQIRGLSSPEVERDNCIDELRRAAHKRDRQIKELNQMVRERKVIASKLERLLAEHDVDLEALRNSKSLRAVALLQTPRRIPRWLRQKTRVVIQRLIRRFYYRIPLPLALKTRAKDVLLRSAAVRRLLGIGIATTPVFAPPARNSDLQEQIDWVRRSVLFDSDWYLQQRQKSMGTYQDPVEHYVMEGAFQGFDPGPFFNTKDYLSLHPDVAKAKSNPLFHFVRYGAREGRSGWTLERVLEWQRPFMDDHEAAGAMAKTSHKNNPLPRLKAGAAVSIFCSSKGNFFFHQFSDLLCLAFKQAGVVAHAWSEENFERRSDQAKIIIAPHEFFYLGSGPALAGDAYFADAMLFNTEQLQTPWFAHAFEYLSRAPWILDINLQSAAILNQLGLAARFLPLGYVEGYAPLGPQKKLPAAPALESMRAPLTQTLPPRRAPLADRPVDVLFVGALSPRREDFFARHAAFFAKGRHFLHLTDMSKPLLLGQESVVDPEAFAALAQRSKILLNAHQGGAPYFEWQRMALYGFWQKTCVVTETAARIPGFIPGAHYFEADLEGLPALMEWLLRDPQGQNAAETAREAAFQAFKKHYSLSAVLRELFGISS